MGYQDLGGPTPINYRPDDDSAMLAIGDALKVQKVCNAFKNDRQRNLKEGKKRTKKKSTSNISSRAVGPHAAGERLISYIVSIEYVHRPTYP